MLHLQYTKVIMMKFYKLIYYRLFILWRKKKDESENARINAIITMSFAMYLNILSVPLSSLAFLKKNFIAIPELESKVVIIFFLIFLGVLNYLLLAKKEKHNKIIQEFNHSKCVFLSVLVYIYLAISFGLPIYIFLFTIP